MTSWMECGCGGDVILYENPDVERYGRRWMILAGDCKACGMHHETVPLSDLKEYRRLMEEDERRQVEEEIARMDPMYKGQVGSITLCEDEDKETCIAKMMACAWHEHPADFWLTRNGRVEQEWTYYEAETEGWFDYHLKLTRWYPINGGDDSEHYDEEYCCQNMEQVRKYLMVGRIVKWELWHRGMDHWKIGGGQLSIDRMNRILEAFA